MSFSYEEIAKFICLGWANEFGFGIYIQCLHAPEAER